MQDAGKDGAEQNKNETHINERWQQGDGEAVVCTTQYKYEGAATTTTAQVCGL